jgi:hypothetical protein
MPEYIVKQGDCISSIAQKHGLFWDKIWNHPKNAKLQETRKDPNVLSPGDVVFVPDKDEREESGATEQRHRFRKKGVPAKLRLQIMEDDQPRSNVPYTLVIDGQILKGTTDGNGKIEHSIPPQAKKGVLILENDTPIPLQLGHIDPIDTISGVQQRLLNLGFDCGGVNGNLTSETKKALKEFQEAYGLTASGELDPATKDKLLEKHGS